MGGASSNSVSNFNIFCPSFGIEHLDNIENNEFVLNFI
jgi:hypothetical protein